MSSLTAKLAPTPFWDLTRDGNTWLIAKGRTYLIGEELTGQYDSKTIPQLCLSGKMYALEESESLNFLEERYIHQHSHIFEELSTKKKRGNAKSEEKAYWQHLAMLASDELTRRYSAEQRRETQEAPEPLGSATERLLAGYAPVSTRTLKRPYTILEERCIEFKRTSKENATAQDTWLRCKGGWHIPVHSQHTKESLEKGLKKAIAKHLQQGLDEILDEQQLGTRTDAARDAKPDQLIDVGTISERRVSFRMALEPFIIRKRGRYYAFPAVELGLELYRKKRGITLPATAKVLSQYLHPFVFPNRTICHGSSQRFERLGIEFSRVYKTTEHDELAHAVATLFDEAAKVLHLGYWKGVKPVHKLMTRKFQHVQCSEEEAEKSGWKIYRQ